MKFGHLFTPAPSSWGLRGDKHLWKSMRQRFAQVDLLTSEDAVTDAVERAFMELTGVPLNSSLPEVEVPAYRVGRAGRCRRRRPSCCSTTSARHQTGGPMQSRTSS
jgi:hypothetical protein